MILEAVGSAGGALILAHKLDIRKVLGYEVVFDIAITGGLAYLFVGTYSGMAAAMLAGLIVSVALSLLRRRLGYKRLVLENWKFKWKEYAPTI